MQSNSVGRVPSDPNQGVQMIKNRMEMRSQSGFTLIELLVVIAILAILAGVAVFAVGNLTDDADKSACQVERDSIRTAIAAADATSANDTYTAFLDGTPKYFSFTPATNTWAATAANTFGTGCPVP